MTDPVYLPNSWELMGIRRYVAQSHPGASDENPGTPDRPFKTITAAARHMEPGDVTIIDEGVYREEVPVPKNGRLYLPRSRVTFMAAPGKRVFLKGSDVFEPEWQQDGECVFVAALPEALFAEGVYNPYVLSLVIDEPGRVRPARGEPVPETLGQIYFDGKPYRQVTRLEDLQREAETFVVSCDGRDISVHCPAGKHPGECLVELTVRERCFKPAFPGLLRMQTMGMVVEHAAEPGAFCYSRPCSLRKNGNTGITVRKEPNIAGTSESHCCLIYGLNYVAKDRPTLRARIVDDTRPGFSPRFYNVVSEDAGRSWQTVSTGDADLLSESYGFYFDAEADRLVRYYLKGDEGQTPDLFTEHRVLYEISRDGGNTWSAPRQVGTGGHWFEILKLDDGSLFWASQHCREPGVFHTHVEIRIGRWADDLASIDWAAGGTLSTTPEKSGSGLAEPHVCQFPDGRLFMVLRAGAVLPSQDHPGVPSVKLYSVSEDRGRTWTEPKPLTYEDGRYVYSPRSYQDTFVSSKNGRAYVILNITDHPTYNCDPRITLNIAEVDMDSLCVKRDTVAIVETKHEEHYHMVRFSNFRILEDRYTKNLLLFMNMNMSEYCPIRCGYDFRGYRYEISLPDRTLERKQDTS